MKELHGDLLALAQNGTFDVIIHGCNCFCTMGAGIAKQIKRAFPQAFEADLATTKGDRDKLGTYTLATVETQHGHAFVVINAYTQFHYRGKGIKVDYDAIRNVMTQIQRDFADKRIGYPRIGAGLAGGDWDTIAGIIDETLNGLDHTLVIWSG